MRTIDDNKSQKKHPFAIDLHKFIDPNELAFRDRDDSDVYVFCPFCGRAMNISAVQIKNEDAGRIQLRNTVSCNCRSDLEYINKTFERRFLSAVPELNDLFVWKVILVLALAAEVAMIVAEAPYGHNFPDDPSVGFIIVFIMPYFLGLMSLIAYHVKPELKYMKMRDPHGDRERVLAFMRKADGLKKREKIIAQLKAEAKAGAQLGAGYGAGQILHDDDIHGSNLDPYDREALHEEELLDDWVTAGGGNPLDFDDRVDAFMDPFGFHDDY